MFRRTPLYVTYATNFCISVSCPRPNAHSSESLTRRMQSTPRQCHSMQQVAQFKEQLNSSETLPWHLGPREGEHPSAGHLPCQLRCNTSKFYSALCVAKWLLNVYIEGYTGIHTGRPIFWTLYNCYNPFSQNPRHCASLEPIAQH